MTNLLLAFLTLAAALPALAQPGIGAKFGSRDPQTCASQKEPARGAPTGAQLREYFICDSERVTGSASSSRLLYLVTGVNVEVAKGRPFNMATDSWSDIDTSQMVYPVRGAYTQWQCVELGKINGDRGKNCTKWEYPHASGVCYKSTFGDWHCKLYDKDSPGPGMERYPPPAGK